MKPICVACHRFLRPVRNGFYFLEGMPANGSRPEPGLSQADQWMPYKLWSGDQWQCPDCGIILIVGTGTGPIAEHYQPDFTERVKRFGATFQVNDC